MARRLISTPALLLFLALPASGATFVVPDDAVFIGKADAIVVGTVLESRSELLPNGHIETIYRIATGEPLKNRQSIGPIFEIREFGGIVGNRMMAMSGAPVYEPGRRYLFFLARGRAGQFRTLDLALGKFSFENRAGAQYLVRDQTDIGGWSSDGAPYAAHPRPAQSFLEKIRKSAAQHVVSAESSASISAGATGLDTSTAAATATSEWSNGTIISYSVGSAATGNTLNLNDGEERIIFDHPDCDAVGDAGLGGAGGECISGSFSGSGVVATAFYSGYLVSAGRVSIAESDVVVQDGVNSSTFNQDKYNSTLTHEIGHTLGFRHSNRSPDNGASCNTSDCSSSAIMNSSVVAGLNGLLQGWDERAVAANYSTLASFDPEYLINNGYVWHRDAPNAVFRTVNAVSHGSDFSGDGKNDLVWRNYLTGQNAVWFMNGRFRLGSMLLEDVSDLNWEIRSAADFNADGHPDLLWRHQIDGRNALWFMNGTSRESSALLAGVTDGNWEIRGTDDFDQNGSPDIVWRNSATGQNAIWLMDGTNRLSAVLVNSVSGGWDIRGTGDFNKDGKPDLVWRDGTTGQNAVWYMNGTSRTGAVLLPTVNDLNWDLQSVVDLDGDESPDLVWRHRSDGRNAVWYMNGTTRTSSAFLPSLTNQDWQIEGPR